ncbi:MAG: hypothetical protein ACYC42_10590 [Lysobacter sp.]
MNLTPILLFIRRPFSPKRSIKPPPGGFFVGRSTASRDGVRDPIVAVNEAIAGVDEAVDGFVVRNDLG